jgi:hypothetical protein
MPRVTTKAKIVIYASGCHHRPKTIKKTIINPVKDLCQKSLMLKTLN